MQMHVHVVLLVLNVSCRMQEFGVVSYTLLLSLIEYKTLVLREDMEAAQQLLPSIPKVTFLLAPHDAHINHAADVCDYTLHAVNACIVPLPSLQAVNYQAPVGCMHDQLKPGLYQKASLYSRDFTSQMHT